MITKNEVLEHYNIPLIPLADICEDLLGYPYERAKYLAKLGAIGLPLIKFQPNSTKARWYVHLDDLTAVIQDKRDGAAEAYHEYVMSDFV